MLTTGPHTALAGGGPGIGLFLFTGEEALELHHAGIGEKKGGVISRDQGGGFHHGVALIFKIIEKFPADIVSSHGSNTKGKITGCLEKGMFFKETRRAKGSS
jgi:hypothetical protein